MCEVHYRDLVTTDDYDGECQGKKMNCNTVSLDIFGSTLSECSISYAVKYQTLCSKENCLCLVLILTIQHKILIFHYK